MGTGQAVAACAVCGSEPQLGNPLWHPTRGDARKLCLACVKEGCRVNRGKPGRPTVAGKVAGSVVVMQTTQPQHIQPDMQVGYDAPCIQSSNPPGQPGEQPGQHPGEDCEGEDCQEGAPAFSAEMLREKVRGGMIVMPAFEPSAEQAMEGCRRYEDVLLRANAATLRQEREKRGRNAHELMLGERERRWREERDAKRAALAAGQQAGEAGGQLAAAAARAAEAAGKPPPAPAAPSRQSPPGQLAVPAPPQQPAISSGGSLQSPEGPATPQPFGGSAATQPAVAAAGAQAVPQPAVASPPLPPVPQSPPLQAPTAGGKLPCQPQRPSLEQQAMLAQHDAQQQLQKQQQQVLLPQSSPPPLPSAGDAPPLAPLPLPPHLQSPQPCQPPVQGAQGVIAEPQLGRSFRGPLSAQEDDMEIQGFVAAYVAKYGALHQLELDSLAQYRRRELLRAMRLPGEAQQAAAVRKLLRKQQGACACCIS